MYPIKRKSKIKTYQKSPAFDNWHIPQPTIHHSPKKYTMRNFSSTLNHFHSFMLLFPPPLLKPMLRVVFTAYLLFGGLLCLHPPHLLPLLPHPLLQAHDAGCPSANHLSLILLSQSVECDSADWFENTHFSLVGHWLMKEPTIFCSLPSWCNTQKML